MMGMSKASNDDAACTTGERTTVEPPRCHHPRCSLPVAHCDLRMRPPQWLVGQNFAAKTVDNLDWLSLKRSKGFEIGRSLKLKVIRKCSRSEKLNYFPVNGPRDI